MKETVYRDDRWMAVNCNDFTLQTMKQSKITILTSVGAGLEYYDLVIYSLLAKFISEQFFPSTNKVAALFATFTIFALGNIVRPLGGVILGIVGDRLGRKEVFANTLLWMAFVTFIMGLIPTFSTLGLAATILFSCCRVLQGLIVGAEVPGALTLLSEHIDTKQQGFHFGFMIAAIGLGVSLGSGVIWLLTKILTEEQLQNWGFRIPFLLGGVLAVLGYFVRKHLPETPKFLNSQKTKIKLTRKVVKDHCWQVVNVIGVLFFPMCLVTFKLIFPTYLHDFYHFDWQDIYLSTTFGYIWSSIMLPIFGWLSDMIGKKPMIIMGSLTMIIFSFPIFLSLQTANTWTLFLFVIYSQTIIALMAASYFVLLPQAFQTVIRYTGTAFSFNVTYTLSALFPLLVNYVFGVLKSPNYLIWFFILTATLTIISTIFLTPKLD